MNISISLLIVFLISTVPAFAQVTHGTIGVIYFTENKIIMAADSRGSEANDTFNDNECKIAALGKSLLLVGGGGGGYAWNGSAVPFGGGRNAGVARRVYDALAAGSPRPPLAVVARPRPAPSRQKSTPLSPTHR